MMHGSKTALTTGKQEANSPEPEHELLGATGAAARDIKLAQLGTVQKQIQAQRMVGTSRNGFVALERLTEAVNAAEKLLQDCAQVKR